VGIVWLVDGVRFSCWRDLVAKLICDVSEREPRESAVLEARWFRFEGARWLLKISDEREREK
jgi:hypothetical protein